MSLCVALLHPSPCDLLLPNPLFSPSKSLFFCLFLSLSVSCLPACLCLPLLPPPISFSPSLSLPGQLKIYLPKKLLECLPKCSSLPKSEIAAYLITFEKHDEWLTTSPKTRPQNGSMILYNRKKVKYRKDGYCWKKRKDGKTTREDHMKLKVQGVECLYGCYVHSSIIPTFHRRCYWLLQNPDIVLVHYLNVPAVDDSGKPCGPVLCSINTDRKEWAKWSKEELIGQLKPMCESALLCLDTHHSPVAVCCCVCPLSGAGSSLHQKCSSVKQRIISSKQESGRAADGTEVQNSDVSEGQTEASPGGGRSRGGGGERRNGRIAKPSLLPQSSMEVSSSTSTNQVEVPDTTQSSPLSITSDMADSPALAIGAGLSQSTAVFMSEVTTLTGDSVYSAGHTHLLASTHESTTAGILLAVAPENQRFASFPGGVGLGEGGELVLSSSLDSGGGVNLPETTMTFDPDCFLNNPKQGQTYGGGGGKTEGCNGDDGGLHCPSNGYVYNPALVNNIKTETTPLEQPLATQSSYVGEGTGLSPSTTLEQMDFSAVMSSACVQNLAQSTHHPSPSLFLQASPQTTQPSQPQSNGPEATQESREAQAYIGLPTVQTDSPSTDENGGGEGGGGGVSATGAGSGGAISLEGFEASFGSQFSDLINDFISVEGSGGGVGTAVTGVLMPQEGAAGEEQGTGATPLQGSEVEQGALGLLQETGRLFGVTDYSPEWSYPEGGVKVLITGPWLESSSEYSCLFDHISVPAALIQPGVLRCYCPAHDTGLVMLQVAMGGEVISSSVVFEYKARDLPALPSSQHDWLSLDDTQFRMSILERLEQMEQRMAEITNQNPSSETMATKGGGVEGGGATDQHSTFQKKCPSSFEGRVVVVCEKMMSQPCWVSSNQLVHSKSSRGMTLLHLAAAQGYAGLIQTLIRWRTKHADSIDLELEVDPLNVDHFSCTPLMWACALGHTEAALVLYQWDPRALAIPDSLGRLPLNIARSRGHTRLAELLEQLQQTPHAHGQPTDTWMDRWSGESQPSGINDSPIPNPNSELRRPRTEGQPNNQTQTQSWSQTGHRAPQGNQGDQGGPPPAKRLKPSPDTPQQLANSPPGANNLNSLLNSTPSPNTLSSAPPSTQQTQTPKLSFQNMDMTMLADHIMEASSGRIKQEASVTMETETVPGKVGISSDVRLLSGYLGDVERLDRFYFRFLYSRPQTASPKPNSLSGPEDQESPQAKQGLPSPYDWSSFLGAAMKEERLKTDSSRLAMTEAEQRELYETIRHALHSLRKHKGPIQEQRKEIAAVVQRCYKRFKQYALYKRMTLAAILIQSRFRSFHEQRKFQQSRRAAVLIQQYYRSYRHSLSSLLTKKQNQAARKILRFLLRCRHSPLMDHRPLKRVSILSLPFFSLSFSPGG
uniref:Calmodulin-binding transcription activator 1 n=1 Tax=Myripristis murdjan TaxID=586833 RepID=A0A667XRR8_9TELE